jgi:hypothetical protein
MPRFSALFGSSASSFPLASASASHSPRVFAQLSANMIDGIPVGLQLFLAGMVGIHCLALAYWMFKVRLVVRVGGLLQLVSGCWG